MDFPAVLAQLNDLPPTFRPAGNPYAQFIASLAGAETLYTAGGDATLQQVLTFSGAIDSWIDVWGLLFGVPRNQGEGNTPYATRIAETVLAWVGTLPALQAWIALFAPGGSVVENASGLGYLITLPAYLSPAQAAAFISSLGRIRPAGVPFAVQQSGFGLFLGTEAFLGDGALLGTYLTVGTKPVTLDLNATTPSAQSLIPTCFLTDPALNSRILSAQGT